MVAGVKHENTGDKLALLKKVELKFHDLAVGRKTFEWFQEKELLKRERERKIIA